MSISDNPSQLGSLGMSLVVSPLVIVAILLRFVATTKAARKIGAEDWFALMATVACLAYNIISIWCIVVLDGREFIQVPLGTLETILKGSYASTQFFPLNQSFAKLSILLLYHRIFGADKRHSTWIKVIGILQISWTVAAVFGLLFQCRPVSHYWDVLSPGRCLSLATTLVAFELPNSAIDFAMVALALVMLRGVRIGRCRRWKLNLLFAAGGFCGVIGFLKIATHFAAPGQRSAVALSLWGNAQMFISVFCCCVPIYNSLFSSSRPSPTHSHLGVAGSGSLQHDDSGHHGLLHKTLSNLSKTLIFRSDRSRSTTTTTTTTTGGGGGGGSLSLSLSSAHRYGHEHVRDWNSTASAVGNGRGGGRFGSYDTEGGGRKEGRRCNSIDSSVLRVDLELGGPIPDMGFGQGEAGWMNFGDEAKTGVPASDGGQGSGCGDEAGDQWFRGRQQ